MALSYPLDFLPSWPGLNDFELRWRKEISRQDGGQIRVKDVRTALWTATFRTRELKPSVLDYWRAVLNSLEDGEKTFKSYPLFRTFPVLYPSGTWPTGASFDGISATVASKGAGNKSMTVDLLPAGYKFSVGDYISVNYSSTKYQLFQVMETATADALGVSTEFEVRPHLPTGLAVNDVVTVKRPFCLMAVDPGSVKASTNDVGRGRISFSATQFI